MNKQLKTVHEVSRICKVTPRTLRHYDSIGLLKPACTAPNGYRMYDDAAIHKLHDIMLLRRLRFSLKEIKEILSRPDYDRKKALADQVVLLQMEAEQLNKIILAAQNILEKGESAMNFDVFDNSEYEKYAAEAKQRWGNTDAYRESEEKNKKRTAEQQNALGKDMMRIFEKMGEIITLGAESEQAQQLVKQLQDFITQNYYNCTKEILSCLGQMYVSDERFKNNIDNAGGAGTAQFAADAIAFYCK